MRARAIWGSPHSAAGAPPRPHAAARGRCHRRRRPHGPRAALRAAGRVRQPSAVGTRRRRRRSCRARRPDTRRRPPDGRRGAAPTTLRQRWTRSPAASAAGFRSSPQVPRAACTDVSRARADLVSIATRAAHNVRRDPKGCLMRPNGASDRDDDLSVRRDNLTARAARWSAGHRRTAILGWFAFVLVAFAIGSAAGVILLKGEEMGIGDSHAAEKVLAREFPNERAARAGAHPEPGGPLGPRRAARGDRRPRRRPFARAGGRGDRVAAGQGQRRPAVARRPLRPGDVPDHGRSRHRAGPRRPRARRDCGGATRAPRPARSASSAMPASTRRSATASPPTSSRPRSPRSR